MKLLPLIHFEVSLEWWNEPKKLTIWIGPKTIEYIKVWGADMDNEMEGGIIDSITSIKDLVSVLKWIFQ